MKSAARHALAFAISASLFAMASAGAANLTPGQRATVAPGDTPEAWTLQGAQLTLQPGSAATSIVATAESTVIMDGATVSTSRTPNAVQISSSTLDMRNSSIINAAERALVLANTAGGGIAASATLTQSRLVGTGLGASVSAIGPGNVTKLIVDSTTIEGLARDATGFWAGQGLGILGSADIQIRNGSTIVGDNHGIYHLEDAFGDTASRTVIDASRVEGRNGSAFYVADARAGREQIETNFIIQNGSQVVGGDGNLLLVEASGATVGFEVDDSQLAGNITNIGGSTVNVALSNNASITGTMTNVTSATLDNATWTLTGNSDVGTLGLGNGTIALGDGSAFHTLNVSGNYSGNGGTILFNTVLAGDDAATDKLVIGGDTSGSTNVRVNNVGGAGAQTSNGIELISVGGASNGQFALAGRAVGGQYEYFLHKGNGTDGNWYLRSVLPTTPDPCVTDPTLPECNPVLPGPDPDPVLRPEGGAYLANLRASQDMFRIGYHDRHAGQNNGRAWARVDGSRQGFDAASRQLDIHGNSQALTVGADLWRAGNGSSVGVTLSTGNATSTSTNPLSGYYARGKVKGEALGLYGTWRAGQLADPYAGFYVDGSVQRAQFRNRVEGVGLDAERYDSRAWQGAVETGYAFRLGSAPNSSLYLEPQLQVGYNRWSDTRHTEANGTVVTTDDADGLFGRVGLRLSGVTRWEGRAAQVQPYLAANWLHSRADSQVRMDGELVDARIPRSRAEVSAGASVKFANGLGVWGGLARQQASGYHLTSAQLGMSYAW